MSTEVPTGWRKAKLGDLGQIITGNTPSTTESSFWNGDIPFVTPSDIDDSPSVKVTERSVTGDGARRGRLLPAKAVLVTCIGTIGKVALTDRACISNQQINALVCQDEVVPEFAYYSILASNDRMKALAGTTTIAIINKTAFSNMQFIVPPILEQRKIANILSSVDDAIQATQRVIDQTRVLRQGLLQDLLTKGIGHSKFTLTEIGLVPESWEVVCLRELCEIKHGFAFDGEFFRDSPTNHILVTPGNFDIGGGFKNSKLKYYDGPVDESYVFADGDLIVGMTDLSKKGDLLGFPAIVPALENISFLHNQRVGKVVIKQRHRVSNGFLFATFCSSRFHSQIVSTATGTTVRHTSPGRILDYVLAIPPVGEQDKITNHLTQAQEVIEQGCDRLKTLRDTRNGLLQDLLTGNVRVNVN